MTVRNVFVVSPKAANSVRLGTLPRLPDTADEIRGIAAALCADPASDVFLGKRANEQTVTAGLVGS